MIQTVNINATLASEVVKSNDKDAFDSLVFAYMIKTTFVSGRINNATTANICRALHVGNRVCRRCLKSALERGYVRQEGNDIIANNLNRRLDYIYPLKIERQRLFERDDKTPKCPFKFTQLRKIIREIVIENHISKQEDFCNTIKCSVNPRSHKQLKCTKRRIKRMCNKPVAENTDRLSIRRVMEITSLKRSTAKSIMRGLVKSNRIAKTPNIEQTDIDIQSQLGISYTETSFKYSVKQWILDFAKYVQQGFPILRWRYIDERDCRLMVDIQYANSYRVNHNKIHLFL